MTRTRATKMPEPHWTESWPKIITVLLAFFLGLGILLSVAIGAQHRWLSLTFTDDTGKRVMPADVHALATKLDERMEALNGKLDEAVTRLEVRPADVLA